MNKNLSYSDISPYIPNIKLYEELKGISTTKLLQELPMCILYQESPSYGHWTLLHNTPDGVEFFDSYGFKPDQEFNIMEWKQPHYIAEALFHLSQNIPIAYNPYKFQKSKEGINTCGRWVILRELLSHLNIDEFAKAITSNAIKLNMGTDELVTHSFKDAAGGFLPRSKIMSVRGKINPELAERSAIALAQYNAFSSKRKKKMIDMLRKVKAANKIYFEEHYSDWFSHHPTATKKERINKAEAIRVEIKEMNRIARNERKQAYLKRHPDKAKQSRFLLEEPEPFNDSDTEAKYEFPVRSPIKKYTFEETNPRAIGKVKK